MFFSKNMFPNPVLVQLLQCDHSALLFGPRSPHNSSTGCPKAFLGVYDHHRGWGAVYPPLRLPGILPDLWIHRSKSQICQNLRCSPRQIYYSPHPGGGHTLTEMHQDNPPMVLWWLYGPNESAERAHRRCCTRTGFWDTFFEKSMHFSVIAKFWFRDLEVSGGPDKKSAQFILFYGHPNT